MKLSFLTVKTCAKCSSDDIATTESADGTTATPAASSPVFFNWFRMKFSPTSGEATGVKFQAFKLNSFALWLENLIMIKNRIVRVRLVYGGDSLENRSTVH